jgi:mRNA interferase MazF
MVAPITSRIRGLPSEVIIGTSEGLKHDSAINLDHVQTVEQAKLSRHLGMLDSQKMLAVCCALAAATDCG